MTQAMRFDIVFRPEVLALFGEGILWSLLLLFASLILGGLFVLPLALARNSAKKWLSGPVWFFTYVMRGTPLLVQLYMIYYGIAQMEWIQARWDTQLPWEWFKYPVFCAVLAFAINTCAYTVEIVAGAMRETTAGEIEAAQAAGFGRFGMLRHIVLPSALRRSLPGYSNEVIFMLHGTALASAVPALTDITGVARGLYADHYIPFTAFISAGLIYLVLSFCLIAGFKLLERRYLAYLQARPA